MLLVLSECLCHFIRHLEIIDCFLIRTIWSLEARLGLLGSVELWQLAIRRHLEFLKFGFVSIGLLGCVFVDQCWVDAKTLYTLLRWWSSLFMMEFFY